MLKQRGETPGNCNVMRDGVVCRKMGGQDAEQVVGADPGLALVQPDTRMGPKRGGEGIVEHPDAFWRGDDVNVVEEAKTASHPGAECASRARRGVRKRRASPVTLLAPFTLVDVVGGPVLIVPRVGAGAGVKTAGHRGGGAGAQGWRARHPAWLP